MNLKKSILVPAVMILFGMVSIVGTLMDTITKTRDDCESGDNLNCEFPNDCQIGEIVIVTCTPNNEQCLNEFSVKKEAECKFCWQTLETEHDCQPVTNCSTNSVKLFQTTCSVHPSVICIGNRQFFKKTRCNWSSGVSWTKTMFLSVVLGGFGVDRFYLGLWKSAVGKLFSFGGLGVWTIVDVILIAVGYIKPADGSLYM